MVGFCMTRRSGPGRAGSAIDGWALSSPAPEELFQQVLDDGTTVLIDGHPYGMPLHRLARELAAENDALLARVDGYFAALVLGQDGSVRGCCDRTGARTLYWSATPAGELAIASRWDLVPPAELNWDPYGLTETLRYRLSTGTATLLRGVSQLPRRHRIAFPPAGEPRHEALPPLVDWPAAHEEVSFRQKIEETRAALETSLGTAADTYDQAAVLLSGGVDSSLIAAIAKAKFRKCLLVTPIFPGDQNPELVVARAFAAALGTEHLLVPIDERAFEADLRTLVRLTGMQVNFHMLAMHQLFRAIPEEYPLVVLGDAADTLFGTKLYAGVARRLRLKQRADRLPSTPANALSRLPLRRARALADLRRRNALDVALEPFAIPYDEASLAIVAGIGDADLGGTYAHRRIRQHLADAGGDDAPALRHVHAYIGLNGRTAQHFSEELLSSACFGKSYFQPFLSPPDLEAARTLTDAQYFGKQHAKPVLRELACEHYDRRLIYRKKHGFEVPYVDWLEGPLAHLVERVRHERRLFDGRLLADLSVRGHYPLIWSLINFQLAAEALADTDTDTRSAPLGIGASADRAGASAPPPGTQRRR